MKNPVMLKFISDHLKPSVSDSIPGWYKTQEMCDIDVYEDVYVYKTQRICNEAVDDCLAASKFIPDWFVTS